MTPTSFDPRHVATMALSLFVILDLLGCIPIFLAYQKRIGPLAPLKTSAAVLLFSFSFLLAGPPLLRVLGIEAWAFKVAGSLILAFLSLELLLGIEIYKAAAGQTDPSIIPIAFPMIIGPGTWSYFIRCQEQYALINIGTAIIINVLLLYLILRHLPLLERCLGQAGELFLQKFMGIILLATAIMLLKESLT